MSKPTLSRTSASAIPILMRLPDLRLPKAGTSVAQEHPSLSEAATAAEVTLAAETPVTAEANQPSHPAASSDVKAIDVPTYGTSQPADELVAPAPPEIQAAATPDGAIASTSSEPEISVAAPVQEVAAAPSAKVDLTDASPTDVAEPVSPAAARRQRALERQRRQAADPPSQRDWWTSHFPVIAIGFLIALVVTIYFARRSAHSGRDQAASSPDVHTLDIDIGPAGEFDVPDLTEPAALTVDETQAAESVAEAPKPLVKSPPLLSAKPKAQEDLRTAAKPVDDKEPPVADQYVSSAAAEESKPVDAKAASAETTDYPSTDAAAYRPGGRVPRQARTLSYPQTSTPHLR